MTLSINDAYALVKNLRSEIIACGNITSSKEGLNDSQKLKIETILQQWTLASNEASKAAELIEAKRVKTQEALIRIAADSLSHGEERLAQFLRHAVTIKMLRKSQFEIAKALQQQRMTDSWAQYECKRADNAEKAAVKALTKLNKLEKFLSKTRAATARARAARRVRERRERRTAEARVAQAMMRCDVGVPLEVAQEKGRYNIHMAIEAACKASDLYRTIYNNNNRACDQMSNEPYRRKAQAAGDKAIFLSVIQAMDTVGEKLKKGGIETEAWAGIQWKALHNHLLRSIKWCDDIAIGCNILRSTPPTFTFSLF